MILSVLVLFSALNCADSKRLSQESEVLLGFYNLDNLFDTIDNPDKADEEFTPNGKYLWNSEKYHQKLNKLSRVLYAFPGGVPDLLGVCELETAAALKNLAKKCSPKAIHRVLHFESEDERGIDVALMYNSDKFKLLDSAAFPLRQSADSSDKSRSVLWAKLLSKTSPDTFQIMVCHFPSRREGKDISAPKRVEAAELCRRIISEKCNTKSSALIICGDFNDEPWDYSMASALKAGNMKNNKQSDLFNLMYTFDKKKEGTYRFRDRWNILDQIIISAALNDGVKSDYVSGSVGILSEKWLFQKGKYAGYPLRTFGGNKWLNGYSDHLPVYVKIRLSNHD